MAIYSGKDWVYGIADGSTFKTAIADDQPFVQLSCDHFTINPDLKKRTPARASGQRHDDIADVSLDNKGSVDNCVVPTEVLKLEIDKMLYSVCQKVVEGESTPYAKTFTFPLAAAFPDFSADAGYFATLIKYAPLASISESVASMVGESLELSFQDGYLFANWGLKGLVFSRTSNPSGTWTKSAQNKFHINDITTCEIGGNAVILKEDGFGISLKVEIVPIDPGSGTWGNLIMVKQSVSATMTVINDANARTAQTAMDSSTETTVQIEWGTTGADGNLDFIIRGIMEAADPVEGVTGDIAFNLHGVSDVANTQEIFTAVVANAVDRAW
jgi:hypothetical protein